MQEETPLSPGAELPVSRETVRDLTDVFKLLSDRSRLTIVLALSRKGPMHVSALVKMLKQTQPAVSHHLALMRRVGLLGCDRNGKHNYYYLASNYLCQLFEQFFRDTGDTQQTLQFEDFSLTFTRRAT